MARLVTRWIEPRKRVAYYVRAQLVPMALRVDNLSNERIFVVGDVSGVAQPPEHLGLLAFEPFDHADSSRLVEPVERAARMKQSRDKPRERSFAALFEQPDGDKGLHADDSRGGPRFIAREQDVDEIG